MKINKLIQKVVPRHDIFFQMFEEDITNLVYAGNTLLQAFKFPLTEEAKSKLILIEDIEHKGDIISHKLFNELSKSFIAPFDREDIHMLIDSIDDVLDNIQGISKRIILYEINSFPASGHKLAEILQESIIELSKAIPLLRDMDNKEKIREALVHINTCENKADDIFEHAVAELFKTCKDPVELIKIKEILVGLEAATDRCEDAANAIESIIIKNT